MPASYILSWDPRHRRWWKQHDGKRYVISCRQLAKLYGVHIPETKEGSYQFANRWWDAKLSEVTKTQPLHPFASYLDVLGSRQALFQQEGNSASASLLANEIARIQQGGLPSFLPDRASPPMLPPPDYHRTEEEPPIEVLRRELSQAEVSELFDPLNAVLNDRVARQKPPVVSEDRTIGGAVAGYLAIERTRVKAGLSPSEYASVRRCLEAFRDWMGPQLPIDMINARKVESYWEHLLTLTIASGTKQKRLRYLRNLVDWLVSFDLIPPPTNLRNRKHKFDSTEKAIETMSVKEVRTLIDEAPGQLRLHLLLMINTGMQQKDISDLLLTEIDWTEGRIIRKRSKTGGKSSKVPLVNYKLWPETLALLRRYRQAEGDRALRTESGRIWVRDALTDEGDRTKTDAIKSNYVHLQKRLNFTKPMKLLRKTSPSILEEHPTYGRYVYHFLGDIPRGIAERHYVTPNQANFDAAVEWLGQQYGYVAVPRVKGEGSGA